MPTAEKLQKNQGKIIGKIPVSRNDEIIGTADVALLGVYRNHWANVVNCPGDPANCGRFNVAAHGFCDISNERITMKRTRTFCTNYPK